MFAKSFVAAAILAVANAADESDRVTSLPGQATFDTYPVYSGYLQIPDMTNKLHYMFVESQNAPTTDPLVIWFNGGPGCSSMLGWAQEHGPYVMKNGTSVFVENEYSWNMKANMLYIESPAGVGGRHHAELHAGPQLRGMKCAAAQGRCGWAPLS